MSFLNLYFSFYWGRSYHLCSLPSRSSILWLINQSSTKRKLLHLPFLLQWVDEISLQRLPYGKITKKSAIWLYPNYGFVYSFLMIPTYFVVWLINQLDWIVRTISPGLHTTYLTIAVINAIKLNITFFIVVFVFYPNWYSPVRIAAMTPPSMSKSVPVMKRACSPSRKAAESAISSLVPVRWAAEASIMRW